MKSLHSVSPHIHRKERLSRTSSMTSVVSSASVNSNVSGLEDSEDAWNVWNKIIGDWENHAKKKTSLIKVFYAFILQNFRLANTCGTW